jgi:hypothetical protein
MLQGYASHKISWAFFLWVKPSLQWCWLQVPLSTQHVAMSCSVHLKPEQDKFISGCTLTIVSAQICAVAHSPSLPQHVSTGVAEQFLSSHSVFSALAT